MSVDRMRHWDAVYQAKAPTGVSWYQPHLRQSLSLVRASPLGKDARVIDVGGGASTLVDDLLDAGFRRPAVLDVSRQALERAKTRLGARADEVTWIEGDVTDVSLPAQAYDVWHDRAVFHFLVTEEDRAAYVAQLRRALRPGGQAVIAAFSPNAPPTCSGLEVIRYSPERLSAELGGGFTLLDSSIEAHQTPFGTTQEFIYCRFALDRAGSA